MGDIDLKPIEKDIVKALYAANKPITTNQVAKRIGSSWSTTYYYLKELYHKNITRFGAYSERGHIHWFLKTKRDKKSL